MHQLQGGWLFTCSAQFWWEGQHLICATCGTYSINCYNLSGCPCRTTMAVLLAHSDKLAYGALTPWAAMNLFCWKTKSDHADGLMIWLCAYRPFTSGETLDMGLSACEISWPLHPDSWFCVGSFLRQGDSDISSVGVSWVISVFFNPRMKQMCFGA